VFRSVSKLDIPTSIKAIGKAYKFGGTNASRSGICVYRAKNADTTIGQYQFGGGSVLYGVFAQWSTIIFESSVESMPSGGFSTTYDTTMPILVFKHGADQDITLNFPSFKSAITVTIYTDCNAVINYDWSAVNITPTIYPLSDYVEG